MVSECHATLHSDIKILLFTTTVYTPDGTRALIGAIETRKYTKNTNNTTNIKKNDVEVDGLGLKERAKGSSIIRNVSGAVATSPIIEYIID